MTNSDHTTDPETVGSPFGYVRPGTIFSTVTGATVTAISIGASGIWTNSGQWAWDNLTAVVTR